PSSRRRITRPGRGAAPPAGQAVATAWSVRQALLCRHRSRAKRSWVAMGVFKPCLCLHLEIGINLVEIDAEIELRGDAAALFFPVATVAQNSAGCFLRGTCKTGLAFPLRLADLHKTLQRQIRMTLAGEIEFAG